MRTRASIAEVIPALAGLGRARRVPASTQSAAASRHHTPGAVVPGHIRVAEDSMSAAVAGAAVLPEPWHSGERRMQEWAGVSHKAAGLGVYSSTQYNLILQSPTCCDSQGCSSEHVRVDTLRPHLQGR